MIAFPAPDPALDYTPRHAAFGIAEDRQGRIALVEVTKPGRAPYFDLPGGAVDGDESEGEALVREFGEETGLVVEVAAHVVDVSQPFLKSNGAPVRNHGGVHVVTLVGDRPELKVENDHELVWLDPRDAVVALRHDGHAWAVAAWLRRG